MSKKKIIFLDIDGVISTQKSHYALDKDACDLLGKIIDAADAKIVNFFVLEKKHGRRYKGRVDNCEAFSSFPISIR